MHLRIHKLLLAPTQRLQMWPSGNGAPLPSLTHLACCTSTSERETEAQRETTTPPTQLNPGESPALPLPHHVTLME